MTDHRAPDLATSSTVQYRTYIHTYVRTYPRREAIQGLALRHVGNVTCRYQPRAKPRRIEQRASGMTRHAARMLLAYRWRSQMAITLCYMFLGRRTRGGVTSRATGRVTRDVDRTASDLWTAMCVPMMHRGIFVGSRARAGDVVSRLSGAKKRKKKKKRAAE